MAKSEQALRALGAMIRRCRTAAQLTQAELGRRAGIVGKYVSEIERGTRDIPFSTLRAIAENGLDLALEVHFEGRDDLVDPELPRPVAEAALAIAELPPEQRGRVLAIVRILLKLVER